MELSHKEFKTIHRYVGWISFFVAYLVVHVFAQEPAPKGIKFEVVSVRVISDKEALARLPDVIGPNVVVRLRLSTSERGREFFSYKDSAIPSAYRVQITDRGIFWFYDGKKASSPGIGGLITSKDMSQWSGMHDHSAIEWEELDLTKYSGEKHAYTIFLKKGDKPLEVISDSFIVPSGDEK
jgi:hypothetical protein